MRFAERTSWNIMEGSDSHTESLRVEQGESADEGRPEQGATPMSLGSMLRGPIGHEDGRDDDSLGTDSADAERKANDERGN
jgi:hypothetical protein